MGLKITNGEINRQILIGAFATFINSDLDIEEYGWDARLLYKDFTDGAEPLIDEREKIKERHQKQGKDGDYLYDKDGNATWKSEQDGLDAIKKLTILSKQEIELSAEQILLPIEDIPYYIDKDEKERRIPLGTMIACEPFVILVRDTGEKNRILDSRKKQASGRQKMIKGKRNGDRG